MTQLRDEELSGMMYRIKVKSLAELKREKSYVHRIHEWMRIEDRLYEEKGWRSLPHYLLYQYQARRRGSGSLAGELTSLVEDIGIRINRNRLMSVMKKMGVPLRNLHESMSGEMNPHYGKPLTKEEKAKMQSPEAREKRGLKHLGKKMSKEARENMRKSWKRRKEEKERKFREELHKRALSDYELEITTNPNYKGQKNLNNTS